MSTHSPPRSPEQRPPNYNRRNGGESPESRYQGRSPTIEEQKSLNMAESLNMRAMEADGQVAEECNWYELRCNGA